MMDGAVSSVAVLIDESRILEHAGDVGAALRQAQKALEQARASGESEQIAAALAQLAHIEFRLGNYERSRELAQEALTWAAPDSAARCRAWLTLGNCAAEGHSLDEAETFYRQAADLARRIEHYAYRAHALHNLANGIYFTRGLFDLALTLEQECAQVVRQHNLGDLLRFPMLSIAWISQVTGQRERARAALDELGGILAPDAAFWGYHAFVSAELLLDEGETAQAHELLRRALAIAEKIGEPGLNGFTRLAMSRCLRLCGDPSAARSWADDAANLARRAGYQHLLGQALIERSRAAWLCGNAEEAIAGLRQARETLAPLDAAFDLARASFLLAAILYAQDDSAADAAWLDAARQITRGGYAFFLEQERALAFSLISEYLNDPNAALADASARLLEHLQRIPPEPLRVMALGGLQVWRGRRRIDRRALRQRRAGELLALLLLCPQRSLSFDQVVEALWPDKSPAAGQMAFHHATSALRRALEPELPDKFPSRYLEVDEGQITLYLPPGSTVDYELFEAMCRQGQWQAALSLYKGEFLPEYMYADWALLPRQRLNQLYQHALLAYAQDCLDVSNFSDALEACRHLLALEPWHEQAVLIGMRACTAMGDKPGALRLYRDLEKALRTDLDAAPSAELEAVYRSLIRTERKK